MAVSALHLRQTNKLIISTDAWSGRFHRLMSSNSAVLKSTIFPEWYETRIQPWVQCVCLPVLRYVADCACSYIPVKVDYTDL